MGQDLYALNATTGALLWKYPAQGTVDGSPAVANGMVYFGESSIPANLYAVNAATGTLVWKYDAGEYVGTPTVVNGVVYFHASSYSLYAVDAATGALRWRKFNVDGPPAAVADGVVYMANNFDILYALDATTGATLWTYSTGHNNSSPVVANGWGLPWLRLSVRL